MPVSSRRCGMITRREAERLCKSFIGDNTPPRLPENFSFSVQHKCAWGCQGAFIPVRYNSSRAKCIKCNYCGMFFSPNKFIFHSHRIEPSGLYVQPDAANFNSWRRHLTLAGEPSLEVIYMWEDVKAMFNGGTRKRLTGPRSSTAFESRPQMLSRQTRDMQDNREAELKSLEAEEKLERKSLISSAAMSGFLGANASGSAGSGAVGNGAISNTPFDYIAKERQAYEICDKTETTAECMLMKDCYMPLKTAHRQAQPPPYVGRCHAAAQSLASKTAASYDSLKNMSGDSKHNTITFSNSDTSISMQCASQSAIISSNLSQFLRTSAFKPVLRTASQATVTLESIGLTISQITPPLFCLNISSPPPPPPRKDLLNSGVGASAAAVNNILDLKTKEDKYYSVSPDIYSNDAGTNASYYNHSDEADDDVSMDDNKDDTVIDIETSEDDDKKPPGLLRNLNGNSNSLLTKLSSNTTDRFAHIENNNNNNDDVYIDVVNENGDTMAEPLKPIRVMPPASIGVAALGVGAKYFNDLKCGGNGGDMSKISGMV